MFGRHLHHRPGVYRAISINTVQILERGPPAAEPLLIALLVGSMSGQTAAPALRPPLHTSSRHRAWRRRRRSRRRRCGARAVVGHRLGPLGRDSLGVAAAPCGQRRPHVCLRRRLPRRAHARRLVRRAVRPSRPAHEQQQRSAASAHAACPQPLLPPPPAQTVARSHLFDVSLVSLALYAVNVACIIGGRPWGSNHRPGADGRAGLPLRCLPPRPRPWRRSLRLCHLQAQADLRAHAALPRRRRRGL